MTDAREATLSNGETLENAVSAKQSYMHILIAALGEQTESELLDLSYDSHIAKQCCDV